jgi:hypothetical protein
MPHFVMISQRAGGWDWSRPMRRQDAWEEHAAFMDALADEGFIVAGGPLGSEDDAPQPWSCVWRKIRGRRWVWCEP